MSVQARFYIDPTTGLPHIYEHNVSEDEVIEVLERPGEDRGGSRGTRVATGQATSGRYLKVVYVPDAGADSVFVITAYELTAQNLASYRKRRKKKHQ